MKTHLVITFLMVSTLLVAAACEASGSVPTPPPVKPTPTPLPTFTPRGQAIAPTNTPPPAPEPSPTVVPPTETSAPTETATATARPAPTKPQATKTPRSPSPTPAPAFDYVIVEQRIKTRAEEPNPNAVNIELYAVDKAGNPIAGVVFRDLELDGEVVSGDKGPGKAQFTFTSAQTYRIIVQADGSGRAVTSQQTLPFTLNFNRSDEVNQLLIAAGHCSSLEDCRRIMHYSCVIRFQRQW